MDRATQADEIRRVSASPAVMLGSVHAVTETGSLLTASMGGSQLGPYVSGAGRVILVVGTQKIVSDLDEGLRRINEYSFPLEDARIEAAYGIHSRVNKVLIINGEITPGRITVVFVDEALGFPGRRRERTPHDNADRHPRSTRRREAILVTDARIRPMMGINVLESLPHPRIPCQLVDPFILVHEGVVPITQERAGLDTTHPAPRVRQPVVRDLGLLEHGPQHRSGRRDGAGAARRRVAPEDPNRPWRVSRRRHRRGPAPRGQGRHRDARRALLGEPGAQGQGRRADCPARAAGGRAVRQEGDAIVRVLVGEGSPVELGTPGLILDVELPKGGTFSSPVPADFNGFVYLLEGEALVSATASRLGPRRSRSRGRASW